MPWADGEEELAVAYRIKLGEKTEKAATKFDGFRITSYSHRAGGSADNLVEDRPVMTALFKAGHGVMTTGPSGDPRAKITTIPIEVHSNEIDEIAACQLIMYRGKKQGRCVGDGVGRALDYRPSPNGLQPVEVSCPCHHSKLINPRGKCKAQMTVLCSIRLPGHRTIGSMAMHRTGSPTSIKRVRGGLKAVKETVGGLIGVPLTMGVELMDTQHGWAPVSHIDLREVSVIEAQQQAESYAAALETGRGRVQQIMSGVSPLAIAPAPGDASEAEHEHIAHEFYPETSGSDDAVDGYGEGVCGDGEID